MRLRLIPFAILVPSSLMAQAEAALNATRANDYIILGRSAGGEVRFTVDREARNQLMHPVKDGLLLSARGGLGLNVMLRYANPLKFTWKVDNKSMDDPLVASSAKFLEAASSLIGVIGGQAATTATATPVPASTSAVTKAALEDGARVAGMSINAASSPVAQTAKGGDPVALGTMRNLPNETNRIRSFFEPALQAWESRLVQTRQQCDALMSVFQQLRTAAGNSDLLLHDATVTQDSGKILTAGDFRATFKKAFNKIAGATTMAALRTARTDVAKIVPQLRAAAKQGDDGLAALKEILGGLKENETLVDDCNNFARDTRSVLLSYIERSKPIVASRATLLGEFEQLNAELAKRIPGEDDEYAFQIGHAEITSGKRTDVTVTLTERNVEFKDDRLVVETKGSSVVKFQVMEHQSLVFDFVQGAAYSNIAYPKFKTNVVDGQAVVADAGASRPRMVAVAMANFIPNTGWSGFTRLIGQIGIGANTDSPVLLAGGGLRLTAPSAMVLTFGAAFPFVQRLKTLTIGANVDGEAALEKDLERALARKPAFYIGFQK